jgi:uncharacterized protein YdeI (YjbR/CyaY-like superfamily)
MAKSIMNPKADFFFNKAGKWSEEYKQLRMIVLDSGLTEELKWGCPCYTLDKKNIVLIHGFKEYCALLFFKGALLKDKKNILIQQTENVQSARQIRFTTVQDVIKKELAVKDLIRQAIAIEKAGSKVNLKKTSDFDMPEEFQNRLNKIPALKNAFNALTPGRQRAYIFHFSKAKQSKTREARIEKYIPKILQGKGLDD